MATSRSIQTKQSFGTLVSQRTIYNLWGPRNFKFLGTQKISNSPKVDLYSFGGSMAAIFEINSEPAIENGKIQSRVQSDLPAQNFWLIRIWLTHVIKWHPKSMFFRHFLKITNLNYRACDYDLSCSIFWIYLYSAVITFESNTIKYQ